MRLWDQNFFSTFQAWFASSCACQPIGCTAHHLSWNHLTHFHTYLQGCLMIIDINQVFLVKLNNDYIVIVVVVVEVATAKCNSLVRLPWPGVPCRTAPKVPKEHRQRLAHAQTQIPHKQQTALPVLILSPLTKLLVLARRWTWIGMIKPETQFKEINMPSCRNGNLYP